MDKEKSKKIQIEMVKRLDELILQKKLTRAEVERKANLGNGTIRNWIVSYPAIDKFYRVAQVLEVSMEYLLYGKLTEKDKRVFQIREIKEIIEKRMENQKKKENNDLLTNHLLACFVFVIILMGYCVFVYYGTLIRKFESYVEEVKYHRELK